MERAIFYLIFFSPQFLAFLLIVLFTNKRANLSAGISVAAASAMALLSWALLWVAWKQPNGIEFAYRWLPFGKNELAIGYLFDRLSAGMFALVATVSLLVQTYSLGYMGEDPGKARYYAFMSLFSWTMCSFVLASNILLGYIFWELVGLASFLLIGFWYEKPAAAAAAKKAFVMTRFGDTGFFLGVILIILFLGNVNYSALNAPNSLAVVSPAMGTLITALIFMGIMGKSAQFPLHAWLPDAMEGPTPVSALIHSATMVAAGIFLFARTFNFFHQAPTTIEWILIIGTITAFSSATMALVQRDIKRILAYSTISQLGTMVMALASGSYFAGVFHLNTHAFFKAMMFLASGCLIHATNTNDIFEIAKTRLAGQKTAFLALLVGALALSGVFPFSGFFSKETILESLEHLPSKAYFWIAFATSFITAVYSFRMIFVLLNGAPQPTLSPEGRGEKGHPHTPHASPGVMNAPLWIMVGVTVVAGWTATSLGKGLFTRFFQVPEMFEFHLSLFAMTQIACAVAVLIAWLSWGKNPILRWHVAIVEKVLLRKYFVDDFYGWVVHGAFLRASRVLDWFDKKVINGAVDLTGRTVIVMGRVLSRVEWGEVQFYLGFAFGTTAIVVAYLTYFK